MVPAYCIPRRFIVVYVFRNSRFSLAISFWSTPYVAWISDIGLRVGGLGGGRDALKSTQAWTPVHQYEVCFSYVAFW
jgi:hypothetical protein